MKFLVLGHETGIFRISGIFGIGDFRISLEFKREDSRRNRETNWERTKNQNSKEAVISPGLPNKKIRELPVFEARTSRPHTFAYAKLHKLLRRRLV